MIALRDQGPKLSDADICNLEKRIGAVLPEQYRQFLLNSNGGFPDNSGMEVVDVEGLEGEIANVHSIFALGGAIESRDIEWNLAILSECRLPEGVLPIAGDSGGSVFCLSLREHDYGAVSYCDLQSVYGRFDVKPEFYPVAPDFDSFLKKIRPFEAAT